MHSFSQNIGGCLTGIGWWKGYEDFYFFLKI
jgi:hypothetical protein